MRLATEVVEGRIIVYSGMDGKKNLTLVVHVGMSSILSVPVANTPLGTSLISKNKPPGVDCLHGCYLSFYKLKLLCKNAIFGRIFQQLNFSMHSEISISQLSL